MGLVVLLHKVHEGVVWTRWQSCLVLQAAECFGVGAISVRRCFWCASRMHSVCQGTSGAVVVRVVCGAAC
jgi:hypothetical protein